MQNWQAEESLHIQREFGDDALLAHLKQWENGDEETYETETVGVGQIQGVAHSVGPDDDGYFMYYSHKFEYVSLDRIIK